MSTNGDFDGIEDQWAFLTESSGRPPGGAHPIPTHVVRPVIVQSSVGSKFASGFFGTCGVMAAIAFMILMVCGGGITFLMNGFSVSQDGPAQHHQRHQAPPANTPEADEALWPRVDFMQQIEQQGQDDMRRIEQQVAEDFEAQYDIAKRNGSAIDAYVAAGFVAAAYLQAEDEANYQRWKAIERQEARRAGMPDAGTPADVIDVSPPGPRPLPLQNNSEAQEKLERIERRLQLDGERTPDQVANRVDMLQRLVEQYPGTHQAARAEELLETHFPDHE